MIQRIQTVYYLLCASITMILPNTFSIAGLGNELITILNNKILLTGFGIITATCIFAIVSFKNRKTQLLLGRLGIIINFLLFGYLIYCSTNLSGGLIDSEKGIGFFTPLACIVLLVLANKAVIKDENLVKSVDRIR